MGRPNEDPGLVASSCYRLLAGLAHYAMSRRPIIPSVSRRTMNGSVVAVIGVGRRSVGRDNSPRRAASPLAPLAEDGLDVQDRGAVDRFEIADREGVFLDRLDRDGVQADRVRAVGRAGREHAR